VIKNIFLQVPSALSQKVRIFERKPSFILISNARIRSRSWRLTPEVASWIRTRPNPQIALTPMRMPPLSVVLPLVALLALTSNAPARIQVQSERSGNVFLTSEPVRIPLTSDGSEIHWKVIDYFGNAVAEGREPLTNEQATIRPDVNRVGYFDLRLTEYRDNEATATLDTSFAVLTPVDVTSMADSPFGAVTHFAQYNDPAALTVLARAGIAHFRDEQYWNAIETKRNIFQYPQKFTLYMDEAAALSLRPLLVLDWSNRFYDYEEGDFTFPHTDSGRGGYIRYALNVLKRYEGRVPFVEVWNEVNAGTFITGPATADKAGYYSLLLKEAYPAIKSSFPSVTVVAGATVPIAHGFFKNLFEHGALPYLDAISIHPYADYLDGVSLEISELRELIRAYNGGESKPIWATEFSFGASNEPDRYIAAHYLAQIGCLMLSQSVERMYYYLAMDDNSFPFRGLIGPASDDRGGFRPHPSLVAYATLIRQLNGAVFERRFETAPSTYAFAFQRGADQVSALWSNYPVVVSLASATPLVVTDIMGTTSTKSPVSGNVSLSLSKDVQFVVGPITSVNETTNDLVADSVTGYTNIPGQNGWSYGYAELGSDAPYSLSAFKEMTWGIWGGDNFRWSRDGGYPFASGSQMHPSDAWAIRRWVSNVGGELTLSGLVSRGDGGDGVNVRIFVDGQEIFRQEVSPTASINYNIPNVKVKVGSKIDFAVNQRDESSFDATTFTSTITRAPQTSSSPSKPRNLRVTGP
jgi:hypothetical protein